MFPNGKSLCGYDSADHAKTVASRAECEAVVLTGSDASPHGLVWHYGEVGKLEYWRAEIGNKILATAERSNPEDFWKTTILGKESPATASITELAQLLQKQLNQN